MVLKNKIDAIGKLIPIIIGIHYFLSYRWLSGLLKIWKIDYLDIITFEDLTFPFAEHNIIIFKFNFLGLILILLILSLIHYIKKQKNTIELQILYLKIKRWVKINKKNKFILVLGLIFSTILLIAFICYIWYQLSKKTTHTISFFFIILSSITYLFIKNNKYFTFFYIQLFCLLIWSNTLIDKILFEVKNDVIQDKKNISISFTLDNEEINTDNKLKFIFHSNKYLIMQKENREIKLFKNKYIKQISINKLNQTKLCQIEQQ